jgi:hypothetical protein
MTNGTNPELPESIGPLMHGLAAADVLPNDSACDGAMCEANVRADTGSSEAAEPFGSMGQRIPAAHRD